MTMCFDGIDESVPESDGVLRTGSLRQNVGLVNDKVGREDAALALCERVLGGGLQLGVAREALVADPLDGNAGGSQSLLVAVGLAL